MRTREMGAGSARVGSGTRVAVSLLLGSVLVLASPAVGPAAPRQAADVPMLPSDVAGWTKTGGPRVFTKADLYGHINGGAEVFLDLGFERLTVQNYAKAGAQITVEIYRMADATAARGIYLAKCGKEKRDLGLKERHTVSRHQLLMQRDRFFFQINNNSGAEGHMSALVAFAGALAAKVPADGAVPALSLLPKANLVSGSERIIRGPVTLQAAYTLGEGDLLQLRGTLTAASGDYAGTPSGSYTLIVADYPTPAAASAALAHIQKNLDSYLKPTTTTPTLLVFQDYEKKYGSVAVTGKRLEVRLHLTRPPA